MLDKIRKFARGDLRPDFHQNLGRGADGWCTDYLRIKYEDLKRRTLEGGTDEEILRWCFQNGRELNANDILIWNEFIRKRGWNDEGSPYSLSAKKKAGCQLGMRFRPCLSISNLMKVEKPDTSLSTLDCGPWILDSGL
jgi:gluconokinase